MSEYLVISQSLQNQEQEQIIRKSEPEPESPPTNQESVSNIEVTKKKKGKENWIFVCHPSGKESALEIIMKPYKHVVKHTTKLIRGMSATYQCTAHVSCPHSYKLIEKHLSDGPHWTLSKLNTHSTVLAPKPRGIDPVIRAKVDELACLGASPLHILETLAASNDLEGVELPTRDQISNRIHGRESKKRKLQMAALKLQRQREFDEQSQNSSLQATSRGVGQQPYLPGNHPQFNTTAQSVDAYEQAYLDLFGPHLLYHSVYYHEYGMGMIVSIPTPLPLPPETNISPMNTNHLYQPVNLYSMSPINLSSPCAEMAVTTLESVVLDTTQTCPSSVNGDDTYISPVVSNSSEPSPHESVPFIAPSLPFIRIPSSSYFPSSSSPSPQWTLLFLHTPPDENGYYMQCPLGCPDCIHGKVHLVVNRSMLLAGLLGAVDVAHVGLNPSNNSSKYWEPEQQQQQQQQQQDQNNQNDQTGHLTFPQSTPLPSAPTPTPPHQDISGLHIAG